MIVGSRSSTLQRGLLPPKVMVSDNVETHKAMLLADAGATNYTRLHSMTSEKFGPPIGDRPCLNDSDVLVYMNNEKVREALHIPSNLGEWEICSVPVSENIEQIVEKTNK
ncbi:unnamed protein product [Anisakis simplex]|uniref:Uncharacterized protein n=1 Tax=Anisakis simplex TaxID=6269 RepID=A0A3P6R466_ANISI|nr:unnamed protein product [Anisakis simplex]